MEINNRYFLCKENFAYELTKDECPQYYGNYYGNSFTSAVTWTYSNATTSYVTERGKREFTGGRVYTLVPFAQKDTLYFYDNWGNQFDVTSHNFDDKFIEISINLTDEETKVVKNLEEKDLFVKITPNGGVYNKEKNCIEKVLYSICVSEKNNDRIWACTGVTFVTTDNILNGLIKCFRNIMRKSESCMAISDCLKGEYHKFISLKMIHIAQKQSFSFGRFL